MDQPLTLKSGLTLPNRLAKAAMAENMAGSSGVPGPAFHRPYGAWATGGWGMILTGNVHVDATYLGYPGETSIGAAAAASAPENHHDPTVLAAWKAWASATQRHGTPALVQLNHPGRQSPWGAGDRSFWTKTLAPSAVPLDLVGGRGSGLVAAAAARVMTPVIFGTPREMTRDDIEEVVRQFASGARLARDAGFAGVEIHAAHGYLLSQFLSARANRRSDEYGGADAGNRARMLVRVVRAVREAVGRGGEEGGDKGGDFTVGVKFNSVDHQAAGELRDAVEQLKMVVAAGVDFVEISGGSWEDPKMMPGAEAVRDARSARTQAREAFFLEFAKAVRAELPPSTPLMVTGGFRSRAGMRHALESGAVDVVGVGRPAALHPDLPKSLIFNPDVPDEDAAVSLPSVKTPLAMRLTGIKSIGAGAESVWYSKQIASIGMESSQ